MYLSEIAQRLRELQATSPATKDELDAWYQQARGFTEWLSHGPDVTLPAQLWHYLHDADIRVKDPEYRASQDEIISGLISDLENGHTPASTGMTISVPLRWIGVFVVVLVAVAIWLAQ